MSSKMKISYHNYDIVLKEAFSVFNDKILDFMKLDIPKINRFIETEFATIETKKEGLYLNFLLEDNSILHIEEEVDLSEDDLIRFASYHLQLYKRYKTEIITVVVCINSPKIENTMIRTEQLNYKIYALDFSKDNADEELERIKKQIKQGEQINELELIFMILKKTNKTRIELLKDIVEVEKQLPYEKQKLEQIVAMTLIAADKFVDREEIEKIWEAIQMLKVIEYAEEKGVEKGIEKGIVQGERIGERKKSYAYTVKLLTKKFGKLPIEYKEKLKKADTEILDLIIDDIFTLQSIEEIEKYL